MLLVRVTDQGQDDFIVLLLVIGQEGVKIKLKTAVLEHRCIRDIHQHRIAVTDHQVVGLNGFAEILPVGGGDFKIPDLEKIGIDRINGQQSVQFWYQFTVTKPAVDGTGFRIVLDITIGKSSHQLIVDLRILRRDNHIGSHGGIVNRQDGNKETILDKVFPIGYLKQNRLDTKPIVRCGEDHQLIEDQDINFITTAGKELEVGCGGLYIGQIW